MNKDMKAPEKIYLDPEIVANSEITFIEAIVPEFRAEKNDKEYISKEAFIEKACSWLKSHYRDYMHNPTGKRLKAFFGGDMCNDFEDYMKGE